MRTIKNATVKNDKRVKVGDWVKIGDTVSGEVKAILSNGQMHFLELDTPPCLMYPAAEAEKVDDLDAATSPAA